MIYLALFFSDPLSFLESFLSVELRWFYYCTFVELKESGSRTQEDDDDDSKGEGSVLLVAGEWRIKGV